MSPTSVTLETRRNPTITASPYSLRPAGETDDANAGAACDSVPGRSDCRLGQKKSARVPGSFTRQTGEDAPDGSRAARAHSASDSGRFTQCDASASGPRTGAAQDAAQHYVLRN